MPTDGGIYWRLTRFSRKTRTQVKHGNNAVIAVNAAVVTWHHLWNVIELLRVANRESICNVKANSHRHTRNDKKLSCLCRVRFGGVNWIPDNSRLSPTENLKPEHVHSPIHTTTPDTTQTGRCELGIRSVLASGRSRSHQQCNRRHRSGAAPGESL